MLKEFVTAIQYYWRAHEFIQKHKMWKWFIIPGIVYACLFVISVLFFIHTASSFNEWFSKKIGLEKWLYIEQESFSGFLFLFTSLTFFLIQLFFYFSIFKFVWLIVCSPLFLFLSRWVECLIEEKPFTYSFFSFLKDVSHAIRLVLRNGLWQMVYLFGLLIVCFIPIVGWFAPITAILLECFYYGFSMLDYGFIQQQKKMNESVFFINNHKGYAIGNGVSFYCIHLLPIIGWVLAPAYAIVAANLCLYAKKNESFL